MTKLEQIEQLRERANVTYDEAKAALEASDGDLLEALIYLEKEGKVEPPSGGGYFSSEKHEHHQENGKKKKQTRVDSDGIMETLEKIGKFLVGLINKGNTTSFDVIQDNDVKMKIPVTILVLLVLFLPWVTIPLAIIGLFFGFKYNVSSMKD